MYPLIFITILYLYLYVISLTETSDFLIYGHLHCLHRLAYFWWFPYLLGPWFFPVWGNPRTCSMVKCLQIFMFPSLTFFMICQPHQPLQLCAHDVCLPWQILNVTWCIRITKLRLLQTLCLPTCFTEDIIHERIVQLYSGHSSHLQSPHSDLLAILLYIILLQYQKWLSCPYKNCNRHWQRSHSITWCTLWKRKLLCLLLFQTITATLFFHILVTLIFRFFHIISLYTTEVARKQHLPMLIVKTSYTADVNNISMVTIEITG